MRMKRVEPRHDQLAAEGSGVNKDQATGFSVLVVDHSLTARRPIRQLLGTEPGIRLLKDATSGAEALALFFQHRPDVVLLDICLPDANGFNVLEQIKCAGTASQVIMLGSSGDSLVRQTCLLLGAPDVCHKSNELTRLLHAIRRLRHERQNSCQRAAPGHPTSS
jgi:DNA-binding NarL/FixJ family response regulator